MVRKQSLKNKSRRNNNNKNKNKNRQRGGDGQMGHTGMPLQYFGKALNRYFPEGDANLESPDSAYGKTHAVSHGMDIGKDNMVGPDLAPITVKLNTAVFKLVVATLAKTVKTRDKTNVTLAKITVTTETKIKDNRDKTKNKTIAKTKYGLLLYQYFLVTTDH